MSGCQSLTFIDESQCGIRFPCLESLIAVRHGIILTKYAFGKAFLKCVLPLRNRQCPEDGSGCLQILICDGSHRTAVLIEPLAFINYLRSADQLRQQNKGNDDHCPHNLIPDTIILFLRQIHIFHNMLQPISIRYSTSLIRSC